MIGLALRIATSMGLHRDGSNFGLSPFECEVRRRLWWHLMLIDIRTSEDFASNPYPYTNNCVRVPANIDDEDMPTLGDRRRLPSLMIVPFDFVVYFSSTDCLLPSWCRVLLT